MGHYDECREGYCGRCGQTEGNCEHTRKPIAEPKALDELKPCPFCGGNPICNEMPDDVPFRFYVVCKGCYVVTDVYATKKAAKEAWNKRVILKNNMSKWISVYDKTPKEKQIVIIHQTGGRISTAIYENVYGYDFFWAAIKQKNVTHWMKLPKPPKKNDGEQND